MYTLNQPWTDLKTKSKQYFAKRIFSAKMLQISTDAGVKLLRVRKREIQGQNAADTVEIIL